MADLWAPPWLAARNQATGLSAAAPLCRDAKKPGFPLLLCGFQLGGKAISKGGGKDAESDVTRGVGRQGTLFG